MGHHLCITIDDQTVMNTDVGTWTATPPDLTKLNLRGGGNKPQPWLQAIMFTIAKLATEQLAGQTAGTTNANGRTDIVVTTRGNGWDMSTTTS